MQAKQLNRGNSLIMNQLLKWDSNSLLYVLASNYNLVCCFFFSFKQFVYLMIQAANVSNRTPSRRSLPPLNAAPARVASAANCLARFAHKVLDGRQIVLSHNIRSRVRPDGTYVNNCVFCGTNRWKDEFYSICCNNGKTSLPGFPDPPPFFEQMWSSSTVEGKIFRVITQDP